MKKLFRTVQFLANIAISFSSLTGSHAPAACAKRASDLKRIYKLGTHAPLRAISRQRSKIPYIFDLSLIPRGSAVKGRIRDRLNLAVSLNPRRGGKILFVASATIESAVANATHLSICAVDRAVNDTAKINGRYATIKYPALNPF